MSGLYRLCPPDLLGRICEDSPMSHPTDRTPPETAIARTLADLPEPAAILFDLDGTLVDTVSKRIAAWQVALGRHGIDAAPERIGGYIGSDGRFLAREMARLAGREMDWAESDVVDQLSGALFDELNKAPVPLPGATELLTALEESGVTFAIATSSQPGQVAVSVSALRLPSPPSITDGSHVAHAKPEPDLLFASAVQLGVPPERCWYVGDATWDMMASSRAGMTGIGVTTGASDATALVVAGALVSIPDLTVLLAALRTRGLVR
jgi:HAD superfamily hydrolase (TIGR01509 family)